jgi:hypothetical protein
MLAIHALRSRNMSAINQRLMNTKVKAQLVIPELSR